MATVFGGRDEMEAAEHCLRKGKLITRRFMDDENALSMTNDWLLNGFTDSEHYYWIDAGSLADIFLNRYITRDDASPLMDALVLWRTTTLQCNFADTHSRAPSPSLQSDEEPLSSSDEREELKRSESEPLRGDKEAHVFKLVKMVESESKQSRRGCKWQGK